MHCRHCERYYAADANYCSHCGQPLEPSQEQDTANIEQHALAEMQFSMQEHAASNAQWISGELAEQSIGEQEQHRQPTSRKNKLAIGIILSLLFTLTFVGAAALFYYYQYEVEVNNTVLKLQQDARTTALAGEYEEALFLLHQASNKRPQFAALLADEEVLYHAIELEELLHMAEMNIEEGSTVEAEQYLDQARSRLTGRKEPLYFKLRSKLDELTVGLKVQKLSRELQFTNSIARITDQLHAVSTLGGDEAAALKERMLEKLVTLSETEAINLLKKKNYPKALEAIDVALQFTQGHESLEQLRRQVTDAQRQYEQAEQQRIEQAMQKAAEEDLINQTAAVDVIHIEQSFDEFGNMTIEGLLRNQATRPIHSIEVQFTIYDLLGNELDNGRARVTPDYVEAGEEMTFTSTIYGAFWQECKVVIDHATWYLD